MERRVASHYTKNKPGDTIPSFMEELLVAFPVAFSIGKG